MSEAWKRVVGIFWSALLWNWALWGPTQYVNLSYVPLKVMCFLHQCLSMHNIYVFLMSAVHSPIEAHLHS